MPEPSPQLKGLKKVLSKRRSSDLPSDASFKDLRQGSTDSITLEKSPTRYSTRSTSQDGSSKSGSSGVRKLLPGHSKRRRRKIHEEELKIAAEDLERGRTAGDLSAAPSPAPALSRRASSLGLPDADNGLLTDDSELETPPLVSRDSHTAYLTMSSPLVSHTTSRTEQDASEVPPVPPLPLFHAHNIPTVREPDEGQGSPSPKSPAIQDGSPIPGILPDRAATMGALDRTDTIAPKSRTDSMSKLRSISPGRRFRDVFGKPNKSPKVSPERRQTDMVTGYSSPLSNQSLATDETVPAPELPTGPVKHPPILDRAQNNSLPNLDTKYRPLTPPSALISTPLTTVTPPTPTDTRFDGAEVTGSPHSEKPTSNGKDENSSIVVSPSGNMISHRKTRSTSSISHQPSKLSNSMTAPLTPTTEDSRNVSGATFGSRAPSGGLFSSWVSAAQNAASTITNLTGPNRSRAGTAASDPSTKPKTIEEPIKEEDEVSEPEIPRKQLAIETMGSGDLNFEHLGLNAEDSATPGAKSDLTEIRKDSILERDEAAAKMEDLLAKRAVSAAYERTPTGTTPVAEISDPMSSMKQAQMISANANGEKTTPNGSLYESEIHSVKRTNSVRSKLGKRRSRGSSVATGHSAIGAMIGASTAALVNPAKGPRLTGFTTAPKQRNRNFHQQFRSVPEDDYLIEDYSCALQKEILLAGRIYISEGHICFFSNILGWVTTVVISFEEVVSIERESTAMVFPNAIAIQTLHARHTFRSLLYREQTYELLIGIWRVSHPASFQKSMNGKQLASNEADVVSGSTPDNGLIVHHSEGSTTDDSNSSGDDDSAPSFVESSASNAASDLAETKTVSRKPSAGMNASAVTQTASIIAGTANDVPPTLTTQAGMLEAAGNGFPGPGSHPPTECTDASTHYDKIIKDEVLHAPLGKIYSLLYGPESGIFVRKFLADDCKCTELVLEDDKKGLNNEIKSRQYTYIKPLGGSIGPRQTKCITTENLDFFDLEKAVTVTCTTQTPDVPSGNAFSVKTRYCLSWAPGNATRLQMNCAIEWTAKSWLKGPIEKGANDGQQQYGDGLVKVLKGAVSGRPRGTTNASKVSKATKKKRKGEKKQKESTVEETMTKSEDWGLFESLRGPFQPATDILRPVLKMEILLVFLTFMVMLLWFRTPRSSSIKLGPYPGYSTLAESERLVAYDTLWAKEENEFWDWLEARANVDTVLFREQSQTRKHSKYSSAGTGNRDDGTSSAEGSKQKRQKQRKKVLSQGGGGAKDVEAKVREERISQREMEDAIKITRERLEVLEGVVERNKKKGSGR
ncbi:uncharacterized protein A1O9_02516 [Exophiala aquamarina CBS 119918]|uniref:VASt domain-containing protein n=1 Tax=Exophiala aquamarina CBS 119918 TaxID=1182545 RepID=A0A072PMH0_9EURO|nr:uncharacterized protein A1O9_02516 [Exophiala aquamarina CBS 119918]KEF60952.1 hypothetical protein A1O9_02516 [Exophiala aquamarina CBS 119918]